MGSVSLGHVSRSPMSDTYETFEVIRFPVIGALDENGSPMATFVKPVIIAVFSSSDIATTYINTHFDMVDTPEGKSPSYAYAVRSSVWNVSELIVVDEGAYRILDAVVLENVTIM